MWANKNDIQLIFNELSTDPIILNDLFQFFADCILKAHSISPVGWVTYEKDGTIVFSIRNVYTISVRKNNNAGEINGIAIMVAESVFDEQLKSQLEALGCTFRGGFKNTGGSREIIIPSGNVDNFVQVIIIVRSAIEKYISNVLKPGEKTSWSKKYNPRITQFLRDALTINIPDPGYYSPQTKSNDLLGVNKMEIFEKIDNYLKAKGYFFTPTQTSYFYTALQTKGFVILSGISGTGKTKLAQLFAEMLPKPAPQKVKNLDNVISITLQPDHIKRHRFIIPKKYIDYFEPLEPNKRVDINLTFDSKMGKCWMRFYDYPPRPSHLMFWLQGEAIEWFEQNYKVGDTLLLIPDFKEDQLCGLMVLSDQDVEGVEEAPDEKEKNYIFLSVRPDWRDSKSLLGYFNPLTKRYEGTPFLEFLLKARNSFETKDGLAWFVILDEMNLARVEYYFADLLSVLESGRDEKGNTIESLRFIYGEMEEGEVPPPAQLSLPPNLYIIGTVNMDETTQSFSPKVLDRAFSLEFVDVDFERYTSSILDEEPSSDPQIDGQWLLNKFTHDSSFVRIDKDEINDFIQVNPEYAQKLQSLNLALQPFNMHFGYRVFDEIMMFLKNAEENHMEAEDAFDQAVLMKVLPKFHGPRGKLEKPLVAVLVWCAKNKDKEAEQLKVAISNPEKEIKPGDWERPTTARRVLRMLESLNSSGFASFG